MENAEAAPRWQIVLAFAIIYLVWGSTFLAIRVGVQQVPPLLFAAGRFLTAGVLVLGWTRLRREPWPTAPQWRCVGLLAFLIFLCDYGLLFWAEQRVPSGVAAVMLATIPVFIALAEILILRTERLTPRLTVALLIGILGVAVLVSRSLRLRSQPIDAAGAIALLLAALSWSIATVLTRKLGLPDSKAVSSGAQMLLGGLMLLLAALGRGEWAAFHPARVTGAAWGSLAYLVVFGSVIGFTAYVWLIHRESPTRVGTYAYVNPVVAVLLGYLLAGEPLGLRTVLGTLCVLGSVLLITTAKRTAAN